jgi:hypothetical protein
LKVHHLKYFFLFILLLVLSGQKGYAQILDDSTKLIYGTHTTSYVLEDDVLNNKKGTNKLDSTLTGFHNYGDLYKGTTIYQNLGNLATATYPVYYQPPNQIGKTLGFNSFSDFAVDPYKVRYYDTRSPYTSVHYMQGSRGQQILEAEFSRNVSSQWNIGFDVRSVSSRRITGVQSTNTTADIRQSSFISVIFFTRYFTKDERYQVLSNLTTLDGKTRENGGVRPDTSIHSPDSIYNAYFDPLAATNLYHARTLQKRFNYHLYQHFSPFKSKVLQVYDIFDYQSRANRYNDQLNTIDSTFYRENFLKGTVQGRGFYDPNATNDRTIYHLAENKLGLKGSSGALSYRVYWRSKYFTYNQSYQMGTTQVNAFKRTFTENFLGAAANFNFKDSSNIAVAGEYYILGNDYFLKADYNGKLFSAGINSIQYSPTLVQREYVSNHFSWFNNNFHSTLSNNAYLGINIKLGNLELKPMVNYSLVTNYIYYDTNALPAQTSKLINMLQGSLDLKFNWKRIYLANFFRYTNISGPGSAFIRMPEFYNLTRIYYQNNFFEKNLHLQVGFDFSRRSTYFANYYMPVTQQFYLNNSFPVNAYWLTDFFVDFQIKKTNFFFKLHNATAGLFNNAGYFTTPYYPGLQRTFVFGLKWMFFD